MKKFVVVALIFSAFTACKDGSGAGEKEEKYSAFIEEASPKVKSLWLNDKGDFRGVALGDSAASVEKTEKAKLQNSYAGMLDYSVEFAKEDWADFQYNFDTENNRITDMLISYEQIKKNELVPDLVNYLTKKYGNPVKNENGFMSWTYKGKNGENILTIETTMNSGWERADIYIERKQQ